MLPIHVTSRGRPRRGSRAVAIRDASSLRTPTAHFQRVSCPVELCLGADVFDAPGESNVDECQSGLIVGTDSVAHLRTWTGCEELDGTPQLPGVSHRGRGEPCIFNVGTGLLRSGTTLRWDGR